MMSNLTMACRALKTLVEDAAVIFDANRRLTNTDGPLAVISDKGLESVKSDPLCFIGMHVAAGGRYHATNRVIIMDENYVW